MIDVAVQKRLKSIGVYTSVNERVRGLRYPAFFTIDSTSDRPTEEELVFIKDAVSNYIAARYPGTRLGRFWDLAVNTITLRKTGRVWTYRRYLWRDPHEWHKPCLPLPDIFKKL